MPENQSINADIYGIYQSKRVPASGKLKCSVQAIKGIYINAFIYILISYLFFYWN